MNETTVAFPGFASPGVGFDEPFEMLEACHERVQRSLDLLQRLIQHVDQHGCDADARSAATDVLRYFDLAGPHHHEDEERHVFPALRDHPDARVREAVSTLQADHVLMHAMWERLRPALLRWRDGTDAAPFTDEERTVAAEFVRAYERHIPLEEEVVYPAARALLDAPDQRAMGHEMADRRRG
ncbi:hemerythrin domain-containing protein [Ottowia sp. GY511]|uniref:Hemerythrin domain-containing protein n=1 Tax=Ottowia flava TaxID=2675430 RepID=A0ABW4KTE3_9BURK|nr:hemerythrin domain-containing protein [Ottowia sp. GY511]TXK28361.1 hemerythrin domain-containing protein [Ottowia sp. GY511]